MVALAAVRRDNHFAEEGVHLGHRQRAAGADAAVAGHGRGDLVEAFLEAQRLVEGGEFVGEVADQALDVALAERRRHRADQHSGRAEPLEVEAETGEFGGARLQPVARRFVELDHFGQQQRLGVDAAVGGCPLHAFEHEALVRRMLVDEDQPILRFGNDIGVGDLPPGDAEGEAVRFRGRCGSGFGAGLRGRREERTGFVEGAKPLPFRGGVGGGDCPSTAELVAAPPQPLP